jgi:hypothetical protein
MVLSAPCQVRVVALAVWLGGCTFLAGQEKKDQIDQWIRQLDAPEFLTRETAMLRLVDAGTDVLPALRPVLNGGSLEATSRALFVVRQLGLAADLDAQDQAGQLLADLAERKETPALARRAAAALAELIQQRSAQSLAELERLGAKVVRSQVAGGLFLDEPVLSIEIGDAFQGEDAELRRLKWTVDAPILILSGKRATDEWVKHAAALPGLEELHLYQAKISEAGLKPLADHTNLKQLGIYHTPVHDEVLAPLAKLPLLAFIKLYGTKVTKDGVEKFKADTNMAVDFRRGAFLGVGGNDFEGGCRIRTVHRGSPAEKAGIMPEDLIVRFGGAEVRSFSGLTDLIAPREFGEEVEIELARRVLDDPGNPIRIVKTKVTLAAWEVETAVQNVRR